MPDFDLLVGGPPCQSWSVAGARKGFEDDRGNLFLEYIRILGGKRPKYFIAENVPGLLSHTSGECFGLLLEKISELGYSIAWRVLNSANFGLAQDRKRVFIVGFLGERCPARILSFGEADRTNNSGEEVKKVQELIGGSQGNRIYSADGLAITQTANGGGFSKTGLYLAMDMNTQPDLTELARCITARQDSGVSNRRGEHSCVFMDLSDEPKITENARCLNTRMDLGITNGQHKSERSGILEETNETANCITVTDKHGIVHTGRVRRLTPTECLALQGFDKSQAEKIKAAGISNAQMYKLAGNAVSVNVVEVIARNLLEFNKEIINE